MTDFAIDSSRTAARVDTRWRTSTHGEDAARPGTLDLSKFISGTHYNIGGRADNVIPSGVAVQYNDSTKMYEPWVPGTPAVGEPGDEDYEAPTGEPIAGFINDDQGIDVYRRQGVAASTKSSFALLVHGIIETAFLPIAAQAAAVKDAQSTGSFVFV